MKSLGFRKFGENKQGLKVLIYGENNTGKSALVLGLKNNIVIDTESKIGSYENNKNFAKNNLGVLSTNDFNQCLKTLRKLIDSQELKDVDTVILDSETKLYKNLSVTMLEIEEKRAEMKAIKKAEKSDKIVDIKYFVDDAAVSQRGYGKIMHKVETLSSLRAKLSEKGKVFVSVAHLKELKETVGDRTVKIGELPDVHKNSPYDFDLTLKTVKEKDLIKGGYKYFVEVEKDTYNIIGNGEKVEITSDDFSKENIITKNINKFILQESGSDKQVGNSFNDLEKVIDNEMQDNEETKNLALDSCLNEFKEIYTQLNKEKRELVKDIIRKYSEDGKITSINNINDMKLAIEEVKEL